jgi:hypothetical protein
MILYLHFVWIPEDGHNHGICDLVYWILDATTTRNDP